MNEKPSSRGEIFVVDDDPAVRETLSIVLSAGGYQVICFADGARHLPNTALFVPYSCYSWFFFVIFSKNVSF